jgi:hypothetical protein
LIHRSVTWLSAANDAGVSGELSRVDPHRVFGVLQERMTVQSFYVVVRANPNLTLAAAGKPIEPVEAPE